MGISYPIVSNIQLHQRRQTFQTFQNSKITDQHPKIILYIFVFVCSTNISSTHMIGGSSQCEGWKVWRRWAGVLLQIISLLQTRWFVRLNQWSTYFSFVC